MQADRAATSRDRAATSWLPPRRRSAHHSAGTDTRPSQASPRNSCRRWRYWSATRVAFSGLMSRMLSTAASGSQTTRCSQIGHSYRTSTTSAAPTTRNPTIKTMNATGPSPLSWARRSSPQNKQRSDTVRKPSKSGPRPHRGQPARRPARKGEIVSSLTPDPPSSAGYRPTNRPRRTGTARRRRRNANTMRPPRNRHACPA